MITRRGLFAGMALALASIVGAIGGASWVEVAEAKKRKRRRKKKDDPYGY